MFRNRVDAGRRLAAALSRLRGQDVVVLGLPRGGVPVAAGVARELGAPLDVLLVRKLGAPGHPEYAIGAIGEGGVRVLDDAVVRMVRVDPATLAAIEQRERVELERRTDRYRAVRAPESLRGRIAVVVDDGVATGATARAACAVARRQGAARVVLATPVAAAASLPALRAVADEVVCLVAPERFFAVGEWYADFDEVTDEAVVEALRNSVRAAGARVFDGSVVVSDGTVSLPALLTVPAGARGVVVFAHGSGSSRLSPRNEYVARVLNDRGIATLLLDLLDEREALDRRHVFDIRLLAERLRIATRWLAAQPATRDLPVGYFGASTGAAAALWAAGDASSTVVAVVSRGGRPDLAAARLHDVRAPTLLLVGSRDEEVLGLNRHAAELLRCEHDVVVIPGATHLFDEPGTLEAAAGIARGWFLRCFDAARAVPRSSAVAGGVR